MKRLAILFLIFCSCKVAAQHALRPLDLNLENYTYPFPVAFIDIKSQGEALRMAFMDVKPDKPNGKVMVLMHGKNFNGAYWEQTARSLAKEGFRVVIPDQIGFGKSSKPAHYQYSFHLLAHNTHLLLSKLGISKAHITGHSIGGMLATRFALMYPEVVEKLILVDPIGLEDYKLKVPFQTVDQWYANELKSTPASMKAYQLASYYHGDWKPAYDQWLNLLAGWTLSKDYPRIAWNSALTYDMIYTQPVCYEFDKLTIPTLLIIGSEDRSAVGKNLASEADRKTLGNYPELGKATLQKLKMGRLEILQGVGHLPQVEDFPAFFALLSHFIQ